MDACLRNLSFVHHIAALSSLEGWADMNEKGRCRAGIQIDSCEEVIRPKPHRMALSCCAPDFSKPLYQWQSNSRLAECDAGHEILEIFMNRGGCADGDFRNFGWSSPYCSPPTRASNPIVHDKQFRSHRSCSPAVVVKPKAISVPSFPASPSVRIEGFECPCEEACLDVYASA